MGFRYRKSVNFGPFRLNFSKSGIGYSIGGKHARYTKKANGGTRTTMTFAGTGISYVKDYSGKPATKKGTSSNPVPSTNPPRNKKPFPWRWVAFIFVVLMLIGSFPSISTLFLLMACVLLFPPLKKYWQLVPNGKTFANILAVVVFVIAAIAYPDQPAERLAVDTTAENTRYEQMQAIEDTEEAQEPAQKQLNEPNQEGQADEPEQSENQVITTSALNQESTQSTITPIITETEESSSADASTENTAPETQYILNTCLLYTSPSPRD